MTVQLYKPLEFLFLVAAFTTLAENFLPQLLTIPKGIVQTVVRSTLSLTFVLSAARVVFNIKGRIMRETAWQYELKGDLTRQRRLEAIDKLMSVLTLLVSSVFGLQALGLDGERGSSFIYLFIYLDWKISINRTTQTLFGQLCVLTVTYVAFLIVSFSLQSTLFWPLVVLVVWLLVWLVVKSLKTFLPASSFFLQTPLK